MSYLLYIGSCAYRQDCRVVCILWDLLQQDKYLNFAFFNKILQFVLKQIECESNQNCCCWGVAFFWDKWLIYLSITYIYNYIYTITSKYCKQYNMFVFTDGPVFKRKIIYPESGGYFRRDLLPGKTETFVCPNVYVIPSNTSISYNWTQ